MSAPAHTPHDDVYGLEISPDFVSDNTAYAIVRGNFFRTVNGGESWQRSVRGLDNRYGFRSLAMSAENEAVLYMSSIGDGIYKSVDGGIRWYAVNAGLDQLDIRRVVAYPGSPSVVLAVGNQSGLYRTTDGGSSWQMVESMSSSETHLTALSFVNAGSQTVYAGDTTGRLYRSGDLGATWVACCDTVDNSAITALAFTDDESVFYVGSDQSGLLRTEDAGASFQELQGPLENAHIESIFVSGREAARRQIFAVVRHGGVYRSGDSGSTWSQVNKGLTINRQALDYGRPTFSLLKGAPDGAGGSTLFTAAFTGIFRSDNGGDSWRPQETLPAEIIAGLAVASPGTREAATVGVTNYMGNAFIIGNNGTAHVYVEQGLAGMELVERVVAPVVSRIEFGFDTSRLLNAPQRLHDIAFSPNFASDQTAFLSMMNFLLRTTDAGHSWEVINIAQEYGFGALLDRGPTMVGYILAVSPDFAEDGTVFIGARDGLLLVSTDRGSTFEELGSINDVITALAISPDFTNDQALFMAGSSKGFHRSEDGGRSWVVANEGLNVESGENLGEFHLAVSPNFGKDRLLLLGTVGGLFKSVDGGKAWLPVPCETCPGDWNIGAVAISPDFAHDNYLLVASKGVGIFQSTDGGSTFSAVNNSLIDQQVSLGNLENSPATSGALKFSPNFAVDRTIYGFSGTTLARSVDGGESWSAVAIAREAATQSSRINLVFGRFLLFPLVLFVGPFGFVAVLILFWRARRSRARRIAPLGSTAS